MSWNYRADDIHQGIENLLNAAEYLKTWDEHKIPPPFVKKRELEAVG